MTIQLTPLKPDILHADEHLLIVNKPSGLASVPGKGNNAHNHLPERLIPRYPSATIVHRLDMATSGLMVVALNKQIHAELSQLFATRNISKTYHAVVTGALSEPEGDIYLPLIADWPNRPKQKVCFDTGKASHTHYRVVTCDHNSSRLELTPSTGRSHQLRVHLAEIGHPILGCPFYADEETRLRAARLLLHASGLAFTHPGTGERVDFRSPPPF